MISRSEARALVEERIGARNLVNHCVATEIIMEALASHLGLCEHDVERWGTVGLVHDLDYADTADDPQRHAHGTVAELTGLIDAEMAHAILAHADKVEPESQMDIALCAADPTTGFIVAAALVRPDKSLAEVKVKSLARRWKEKAFARGASREQMIMCESLGIPRDEYLGIALCAMQERAGEIGL